MKTKKLFLTIFFFLNCQPLPAQFNIPEYLRANTDGTSGFYLKQVNGPVLVANNELLEFYPASSAKVLQHLHAMLRVQSGEVALTDLIDIPRDSCEDLADYSFSKPRPRLAFSEVLRRMMQDSDNQLSNVIQDKFGRAAINETVHELAAMSTTSHLDHKFGCTNVRRLTNRLTLVDLGALYETVVRGDLLSKESRDAFYGLMPNKTTSFFIKGIINQEAEALQISEGKRDRFKSHVKLAYKPGSKWRDGLIYFSRGGYVSLPFVPDCNRFGQIRSREFVFGVFIHGASRITDDADWYVSRELFRDQIRQALQTWKNCPAILEVRPGVRS